MYWKRERERVRERECIKRGGYREEGREKNTVRINGTAYELKEIHNNLYWKRERERERERESVY